MPRDVAHEGTFDTYVLKLLHGTELDIWTNSDAANLAG
jgi:hypothetical protein